MELFAVIELAVSALGMGNDVGKYIREKLAKKVLVTPNDIATTSRRWDSTNSVIVQNQSNKPLFSVQIVFWHDGEQELDFKFEKVTKEAQISNIVIDYGVVIFRGEAKGHKVVFAEILRLLPRETVEIDLQIKKRGSVKIFPASYAETRSKQILNSNNEFAYPFSPPFEMQLNSIALLLRKL